MNVLLVVNNFPLNCLHYTPFGTAFLKSSNKSDSLQGMSIKIPASRGDKGKTLMLGENTQNKVVNASQPMGSLFACHAGAVFQQSDIAPVGKQIIQLENNQWK